VTRLFVSPRARGDIERIFDFLFSRSPEDATARIEFLLEALSGLCERPQAGRPATVGLRELVITAGTGGYLALYRHDPVLDIVHVLALRSQREGQYKRDPFWY